MGKVQVHPGQASHPEGLQHQADHFQVCRFRGTAKQFATGLDRRTAGQHVTRAGMQNMAGIAQAGNTVLAQGMGINAGGLGRHIGAHTHHPASQLVGELEGLQFQVVSGACKQGLEIFDQRGNYQLVAPTLAGVHYFPAQGFDLSGQRWKNIFDTIWQ